MCIRPSFIHHPDGVEYGTISVPCRDCWQCIKLRQDDLVGRCLAEQAFSRWSCAVTLTYREGVAREKDLAHRELYPRHFQNWIKRLRKRGHSIRYLGVGEKGSLFGRAHFHAILFGQSPQPDWPSDRSHRWHSDEWDHGFVSTEFTPSAKAMRYAVKYLTKGEKWFTLSKKPPLASAFFAQKAARDYALGVIPYRWEYRPPNAEDGRTYLMSGTVRRDYLLALADLHGVDVSSLPDRGSEWVQKACFKVERWQRRRLDEDNLRKYPQEVWERFFDDVERKRPRIARPLILPDNDTPYPHEGKTGVIRDTNGGNPTALQWPSLGDIRSRQIRDDWRKVDRGPDEGSRLLASNPDLTVTLATDQVSGRIVSVSKALRAIDCS